MPSVTPISGSTPATTTPQGQVQGEAVQAQVTKLPPSLENVDRALTLRGEVQAVNEDGTVRIATPRGPVDVKLPDPQPTRGQQVEVQIPAGSPPRTAAVTVQQQPAPQPLPPQTTVPPLPPTAAQPAPLPQAPTPATAPTITPQAQAPTSPAQSIPAQPAQTPAPTSAQPQLPAQNAPIQNAAGQNAPASQTPAQPAQTPQISPQGLLNFLKDSLQTILKNPAAQNAAANASDAPARPIQLGQLVRLSPLPANQTPQALPQTAITKAILPLPQSAASISVQITAQKPIAMPALPLQLGTPTQTQTLLNPAIQLNGAQTPSAPDAIARILMPMLNASASPASAPGTPIIQTAIPSLMTALQTPDTIPTPHQPALVVPSTPHAQILPQATDVRVAAILPNMTAPMLQNAGTTTLLHGTPTAPSLFAQVAGQTPQGLPVITLPTFTPLPDGTQKPANLLMALQFPTRALAPNAILRLDVLQQPMSLASPISAPTLSSAVTWDTLDDILQSQPNQPQTQAQAQMQAITAGLPKPGGAAFSAPVLMFIAALRGGDITSWMGEKGIDAIKMSRRTDALSKLLSDFTNNARSMDDRTPVSEWRSATLPMLYGQELSRINLYYRSFERDGDEQGAFEKQKGTRFIMDLSLTRMGPMQIDGFSVGKKLDVTLRSEQTLSPGMREAMRTRYSDAITGIGFAGNLHFSSDLEHKGWVTFENQAARESKFI